MGKSRPVAEGKGPKDKSKTGHGKEKKNGKKSKKKDSLEEQVLAMGGDKSDLELLSGVRGDEQLVQGEANVDSTLAGELNNFLQKLQSGGETTRKQSKRSDSTEEKAKDNVKEKSKKEKGDKQKPERKGKRENEKEKSQKDKKAKETSKSVETKLDPVTTSIFQPSTKSNGKLVFPPNAHWYSVLSPLAPVASIPTPTAEQISSLNTKASFLLQTDSETYASSPAYNGNSASDAHFLQTILSKGTLSDRLSALTLLVQASPVHNIKALETLKGMAERGRGKGGREEGLKAMRCVVDWWIGGGAPARKLRYLRDQPLLHPGATDQHLMLWYFEDWLKKYFFSVLQILETYSLDSLPYVRTQALGFISTLLREKPEQEQNLLRLLVNKLGDTEKSVCSRASYHLLQLLQSHPAMKGVIVREVRALIFRPISSSSATSTETAPRQNTKIRFDDSDEKPGSTKKSFSKDRHTKVDTMERWNWHAWYYASVTLNQVVLTPSDNDREVARILIEAYFEMFQEILGSTGKSSAASQDLGDEPHDDGDDGARKKGKGKKKEVRGDAGFAEVEDSNSRLISAVLTGVNRALPYAKVDMTSGGDDVFKRHIDTLFLITHTSTFNISLQALVLILQVCTTFASTSTASSSKQQNNATPYSVTIIDRFYRTLYASLFDPRLAASSKQAMYLNLLFKAMKADKNVERVKAFVRRFVQVLGAGIGGGAGGAEFVAGGLYLLGEVFSTIPGLRAMFGSQDTSSRSAETYDPTKRDPQYAHAASSPLYELSPLLYHFHPSIRLHARQLLNGQPLTASPDLSLNTLSHFLDRFVYKNPKKPKAKGGSAMQPAASGEGDGSVKLVKGEVGETPVNEEKWWKRRVEDIPVDQVFFHKYFTRKSEKEKNMADKAKKRKGRGEGSDTESEDDSDVEEEISEVVGSDEEADEVKEVKEGEESEQDSDKEEAEVWKAMKATMPDELQDDDLSDSEDDMPSGLDDSTDEDEEENAEGSKGHAQDEDEEDDAFSLVEASDAEDLVSLNDDIPEGLIDFDGANSEVSAPEDEGEWGGISKTKNQKKRKREEEDGKKRRKKLRSLPTFASYEDYAKMIEDGPEDNI